LWLTVENTDLCICTCIYTLGGRVALAPPVIAWVEGTGTFLWCGFPAE